MFWYFRLMLLLAGLGLAALPAVAAPSAYLDQLIETSRQMRLSQQTMWLNLGHYRPRLWGGYMSQADSGNFFLAPDGKENPEGELNATLAAFFSEVEETDQKQHPQCAFKARYQWLKEQLNFDPKLLPEKKCARFEKWYQAINPAQVTLVFPAAYLNNPSSMFGHSLLRFDMPDQNERTRILSYTINFAASTDETNGIAFAVKGLTGMYTGRFSIIPYYEKVKEYNDLESRDIWEFQLNFSQAEIRRMLEHVWELGPVGFDYYFLDENCSYQLLGVLEVGRPSLRLSERFPLTVIPTDTVTAVVEEAGMLRKAVYRPSASSLLAYRLSLVSPELRQLAFRLSQDPADSGDLSHWPLLDQARVLESAFDYVQFQYYRGNRERKEMARVSLELLRQRSQVAVESPPLEVPSPGTRPDLGHGSARLAVGGGIMDGQGFAEIRLRPSYHDHMDPPTGFLPGAQISFLDIQARQYQETQPLRLERFILVDVDSLSPRDQFFKPRSWSVSAGWERLPLFSQPDAPIPFYLKGGAGVSYGWGDHLLTLRLEGQLWASPDLPSGRRAGLGPSLVWLSPPASPYRAKLTARGLWLDGEAKERYQDVKLEQAVYMSRNWALRLDVARQGVKPYHEARLALQGYF